MKNIFFFCLLIISAATAKAGDSTEIKINKFSFSANDTIEFSCSIHDFARRGLATATLNIWIQDIEKKQTWKFRYPVLNGEVSGSLAISDSILPGKYAVNFILQKGLFRINGNLKDNKSYNKLNYLMMAKGKQTLFNTVDLDASGNFIVKNILFQDEAFFVFTPSKKVKRNDLFINVSAPLDSAFTPIGVYTQVIDVKPELIKKTEEKQAPYKFDFNKTYINTTLPDVIVYAKGKSKVQQYEETYVSGLFRDDNAKVYDGIDGYEISSYIDIPSFLQAKIPGLRIDRENNDKMTWREQPVTVYIDEFKLDEGESIFLSPSEVAMIKVYAPPAQINSGGNGGGGAVAIYTKKGNFENNTTRKFRFTFKGYNSLDGVWK